MNFKDFKINKYVYEEDEFMKLEEIIQLKVSRVQQYTRNEIRRLCRLIINSNLRLSQLANCQIEVRYTSPRVSQNNLNVINADLKNIKGANATAKINECKSEIHKTMVFKIKEIIRILEERLERKNMEDYCYKLAEKELMFNEKDKYSMKTRFLIVKKIEYFVFDLYDCIKDMYVSERLRSTYLY